MSRGKKKATDRGHREDRTPLVESLPVREPIDPELFDLALTHRSYSYENGEVPHNERLEFLGDAVLGQATAFYLYATYPEAPQGVLSRRRSAVVNMRALAWLARSHNLGAYIKLGKGEAQSGGRNRSSILADTTEAIIGAVHLTSGSAVSHRFVLDMLAPIMDNDEFLRSEYDYKTRLQEIAVEYDTVPKYAITDLETVPPSYRATVTIGTVLSGTGEGTSKKDAEREAARRAVDGYYAAKGETLNLFEEL